MHINQHIVVFSYWQLFLNSTITWGLISVPCSYLYIRGRLPANVRVSKNYTYHKEHYVMFSNNVLSLHLSKTKEVYLSEHGFQMTVAGSIHAIVLHKFPWIWKLWGSVSEISDHNITSEWMTKRVIYLPVIWLLMLSRGNIQPYHDDDINARSQDTLVFLWYTVHSECTRTS